MQNEILNSNLCLFNTCNFTNSETWWQFKLEYSQVYSCRNKPRKAWQNCVPFSSKMLLKKIIVHILQQRKSESYRYDMHIVLYIRTVVIFSSKSLNTLIILCGCCSVVEHSALPCVNLYTYNFKQSVKTFLFRKAVEQCSLVHL